MTFSDHLPKYELLLHETGASISNFTAESGSWSVSGGKISCPDGVLQSDILTPGLIRYVSATIRFSANAMFGIGFDGFASSENSASIGRPLTEPGFGIKVLRSGGTGLFYLYTRPSSYRNNQPPDLQIASLGALSTGVDYQVGMRFDPYANFEFYWEGELLDRYTVSYGFADMGPTLFLESDGAGVLVSNIRVYGHNMGLPTVN